MTIENSTRATDDGDTARAARILIASACLGRRRETELDAHQRWLERGWRVKRGGNFHLDWMAFKVVVFMVYREKVRWQARVLHRDSGQKVFSRHYRTIEEAQIAALALLMEMYVKEGYE
jgi:hypothetical protein